MLLISIIGFSLIKITDFVSGILKGSVFYFAVKANAGIIRVKRVLKVNL